MRTDRSLRGVSIFRLAAPHAAVIVLAAPPVILLASVTPPAFFLPTLSLVAMALAAIVALVAWARGASLVEDRVSLWDIAGAIAFIACGAGILSNPEDVLQMFGGAPTP